MKKKQYYTPALHLRPVHPSDVIITSDPQVSDDPTDGGSQQAPRSGSDWSEYTDQ